MSVTVDEVRAFIEDQRPKQQKFFGAPAPDKVLAHVASTSASGSFASVSAHRLLGLARGHSAAELVARLSGALPRRPGAGEVASVCLFNQFVGYQLKTRLGGTGATIEQADGTTTIHGGHVYTLHHSPFMMTAFERIPLEEVLGSVGSAPFALVGVGTQVNLSPRFNWHTEARDGKLVLFHGDGLPLKTYLNLKSNPSVVRILIDPTTFTGYVLEGVVEEFVAAQEPVAHRAICAGFAAGGWGRPARTFRYTATRLARLALQA